MSGVGGIFSSFKELLFHERLCSIGQVKNIGPEYRELVPGSQSSSGRGTLFGSLVHYCFFIKKFEIVT